LALDDMVEAVASSAPVSDQQMQELAREALRVHGVSTVPSVVDYCVDIVRSGRRPSALGHLAHGFEEAARSVKDVVRILKATSMPGFLNPPRNHEQLEWDDDAEDWVLVVDVDTSTESTVDVLHRIMREVPYDRDAALESDAAQSFTVWLRNEPLIEVMAGKSCIGRLNQADSDALRPQVRETQRRGHVLAAEADIVGSSIDDVSVRLWLPRDPARGAGDNGLA
jgi:hypothetical protein